MRKNIFICIIFAVSISACTEEIDKEVNIKVSSSLNDLSENEALAIAKTFHGSVTFESRTRESNIAFDTKSIYRLHASEKTRALSNEELPLIYEIVVNDGLENGKIIVSGDKRCPEVLAYMPSFDDSLYKVSAGPNIMVATLVKYIYNTIGTQPVWGESYNYDKWTATGPSTEIIKSVIAMDTPIQRISNAKV